MEFPYQLVAFFDKEPDLGEFVYQGENGWYPQVALKRRFAFHELSEEEGLERVEQFIGTVSSFDIHFGQRIQPPLMPVEVIEVVDSPKVITFHQDFITAMGSSIVSKFPEREGENYYPHMTITWKGEDVVKTDAFTGQSRKVTKVWMLKDDEQVGDSRAYRVFNLHEE